MAISGVAFGSWLAYRLCEQYLSKEFFNALSTKLGDAFVSNLSKSIEQAIDNLCSEKQITGATMTLTEFCDIFLPLCMAAHMSSARASEALSTLFILTDTKEMSTITWKELTERLLDCIQHIRSNQDVTYMSKNQDSSQLDWYISAKNTSDNVPRGDSSLRVQMSLCEATGSLYVLAAREIMRFNFFTWDACQVLTDADSEMISTSNYDPVHFESFCVDHGREIISTCDAKGVIRCFHTSGQEQAHYYLDSNTFKGNHCEPGEVHTTWIQVSWSVFGVLIRSIQGIVGVFPHANPCSKLGELDDPVMHPNEAFRATSMFVTENGQYVHWVSSELDSHTLSIWKVATCVSGFPCNPQIASERNKTMNKNLKPCGGRTPLHWVRKISSCTFQLSCNEAASYSDILLYASDTNSSSTIVACSEEVCAFSTPPRFDRIIPLFKLQLGSKVMSMSYHRSNHALLLGDESGVLSWACFPKDGTSLSKLRATPHGLPHFEKANQIRGSVQCFHTAICAIEWILATETLVCANDRFDLALLRSIQAGEHFFTVFRHVTLTFAPIRLNYDGVKAPTQPSDSMDSVPTESRVVEGSLLSSRGEDKNSRRTGYKCNQAPNLTSRFKHLMIKQGVRGDSTRNVSGVNSTTANDSKSARSCRSSPFSGSLNQPQHLESICTPGKIDRQSRNKERIKDGTLSALPGIRNEKREAIPQEPKKRWNHMFRKKMFCPNYREELHMPQTSSSASNYPIGTDSALAASSITKDSARPLQRFLPFELISLRANLSRRGRHGLLCRLQQRSTVQDVVVDHASREIFFQPTNCQETRRARKV